MADLPAPIRPVADAVNARLSQLLDTEQARWDLVDPRLGEAVTELRRISTGGKRLRAAFCYWAWKGTQQEFAPAAHESEVEPDEQAIIDIGTAFELLQTFALIHDDVMDDADTRRGEVTIHVEQATKMTEAKWHGEPRRYGDGVAILIGDLSHVYADRLTRGATPEALNIWDELRIELNLGQYLDIRTAASGHRDRPTAQRIATFKSALYTIVRPLQMGAALVVDGREPQLMAALDNFGRPVGQAFQLRDDLLGVIGDEQTVGKPVGGDILEGKPTELVAIASERATASQHEVLKLIGNPGLSEDAVMSVIQVMSDTGALAAIEQRVDELVESATRLAGELPFDSSVRLTLIELAEYVAARSH